MTTDIIVSRIDRVAPIAIYRDLTVREADAIMSRLTLEPGQVARRVERLTP